MDNGYYLYAVCNSSDSNIGQQYQSTSGIDPDYCLEGIQYNKLCAIVSQVPMADFGKDRLVQNINEMSWLEVKARMHDAILRNLSALDTMLPVRFGTVFLSASGIEDFIEQNYQELENLLATLNGCLEMGVTLRFDKRAVIEQLQSTDIELQELEQKVNASSAGAAYLLRKRLESLQESKFKTLVEEQIDYTNLVFSGLTKEVKQGALTADPIDQSALQVSIAFLVQTAHIDEFKNRGKRWQDICDIAAISTRITGPWPPYSFARLSQSVQSGRR